MILIPDRNFKASKAIPSAVILLSNLALQVTSFKEVIDFLKPEKYQN